MRLLNFLSEIEWKKARDLDFPGDSNLVIFFKPNEVYRQEGQAHGLLSHAIKHLYEFKPNIRPQVMKEFNSIIANVKELWVNNKQTEHRAFGWDTILNTLDQINDKFENHKELLPIEQEILNRIIKPMAEVYDKFASDLIQDATVIKPSFTEAEIKQLLKRGLTISFPTKYHDLHRIVYVNINHGYFLSTTKDGRFVCTFYKNTPSKIIAAVMRQDISNPNVKKVFSQWD